MSEKNKRLIDFSGANISGPVRIGGVSGGNQQSASANFGNDSTTAVVTTPGQILVNHNDTLMRIEIEVDQHGRMNVVVHVLRNPGKHYVIADARNNDLHL
jgi:hypothetical protein